MIKFVGKDEDGNPLYGFGLSAGNLQLLQDGRPIRVNLSDIGAAPGTVIILYGTTEQEILEQLQPAISPATEIHRQTRGHEG